MPLELNLTRKFIAHGFNMQFELNSREKAHSPWATHAIRTFKTSNKVQRSWATQAFKAKISRESPLLMGDTCDRTETSPEMSKLMCDTCD